MQSLVGDWESNQAPPIEASNLRLCGVTPLCTLCIFNKCAKISNTLNSCCRREVLYILRKINLKIL